MEKRVSDRSLKRFKVLYGTDKPDKPAFTKNISPTGLRLSTNRVFRPGTRLILRLLLPDGPLDIWARVAWAKQVPAQLAHVMDGGMGLRLESPPQEWIEFCEKIQVNG